MSKRGKPTLLDDILYHTVIPAPWCVVLGVFIAAAVMALIRINRS